MSDNLNKPVAVILDDDAEALGYATLLFQDCGFEVTGCRKRSELALALKKGADLIVLDLLMPERDGIQVLHLLAKYQVRCPLILVSMCPRSVLRAASSVARMLGFEVLGQLRKPYFKPDLMALVEPTIGKQALPEVHSGDLGRLVSAGCVINHYQPIVDVDRARVIRVEALARLHHPRLGLVEPVRFLPLARRMGLRLQFELRLLRAAIEDAVKFAAQGCRVPVSVNLSTTTVAEPDFPDQLEALCRELRYLISQMTIEISERDLYHDFLSVLTNLTRLCLRGGTVTLDEFGSGFSVPAQLDNLPLNEIKLSRSLVDDCTDDLSRRAELVKIVQYAHAEEIRVVAVGVERPEQLGLLYDLGVRCFQGHLFSAARQFDGALYWIKNSEAHLRGLGFSSQLRKVSSG